MAMYPDLFPLQYLAALCLPYAAFVAYWALHGRRDHPVVFRVQEVAVLAAAYLVGSALCGALWMLHDMHAGYFPAFPRLTANLIEGAVAGPVVGVRMAARSSPLSVAALGIAGAVAEVARLAIDRCSKSGRVRALGDCRRG